MKPIKIGPVFMISIMVLAGVGVSYAHWEEKLFVSGIMYTDNIHPFFQNALSNDPYGDDVWLDPWECGSWAYPSEYPEDWSGQRKNKDVGCTDVYIDAPDGKPNTRLNINVYDAYPCYYSHVYWEIVNDGSVPVNLVSYKLKSLSLTVDVNGDGEPDIDVVIPKNRDLVLGTEYYIRWHDDGTVSIREGEPANPDNFDFMIMPTGNFAIGDQLDPNYWDPLQHFVNPQDYCPVFYADLCIHFLNGCWQLATYDFDLEMVFYNWPEECVPEEEPSLTHKADLMLVLDRSGSIDATELQLLKDAANAFITTIHMDDSITGQSSFNEVATLDRHLTADQAAAHAAVNALTSSGYTNLHDGLELAYDELMLGTYDAGNDPISSVGDRVPDADYPDYIVVITDGNWNVGSDPTLVANMCDAAGIEIYVFGIGTDVDATFLMNNIATVPGNYYAVDFTTLQAALLALIS